MTIAGGIMGALFHRERTGEATTVDVSLFATGMWSMGAAMAISLALGMPWTAPPASRVPNNPLVRNYRTKDGRIIALTCLQAGKYWPEMCDLIGRPECKDDERFADAQRIMANGADAVAVLEEAFASATLDEWRSRLDGFSGQWAAVQSTLEVATDPQTIANGYLVQNHTSNGTPYQLVAVPIQYDEAPAQSSRAPEFNEHGDAILESLGLDWDAIVDLKLRNVVA
jgi:crotonobetainyl-CoA:carnitine CoA-transferase CaiB-like acyl-CoA transferase